MIKLDMDSTSFYADLPLLTEFSDAGRQERYAALPDDWHVVMCDVRNSTAAVEAGRYKNVNPRHRARRDQPHGIGLRAQQQHDQTGAGVVREIP